VAGVIRGEGSVDADGRRTPVARYDEEYYESHCGVPYRRGTGGWEAFFGGIADAIVDRFGPRTVLDAGCAIGFLVEALRARGVDAEGIDISEYAISQVPAALRPYVRVAPITEELAHDYDLITCIEVLEHVSEEEAAAAVANFARHTQRVLFSSTPDDDKEPTHVNVRPPEYWSELFARSGLFHDPTIDASFVTPHAMVYRCEEVGRFAGMVESLVRSERASHTAEQARLAAEVARLRLDLELQVRALRGSLAIAEREAAAWRELQQRGGWRIFASLVAFRLRIAPPGSVRDSALRSALRRVANVLERPARRQVPASEAGTHPEPSAVPARAVLYLSGCPGDSFRYRCEHQSAGLMLAGGTADNALVGSIDLASACDRYAAFVLHRVRWDEEIARLVDHARAEGKPVIFDTDDLVYEHHAIPFIDALTHLDEVLRNAFADALVDFRRTLFEVGAASVSTETLRESAAQLVRSVVTIPNVVSEEMVRMATQARASRGTRETPEVVVAYLSGTPTHDSDFLEAADAVLWALERYENVRFMAVGYLRLDDRFDGFADRVERIPFLPWQDLPKLMAGVDINLAPLEAGNPFTEAKSCLKYLEAGLLGVPTLASPRHDFARVIRQGENGLLAETPEEWRDALRRLIEAPQQRASIGANAFDDVHRNRTARACARSQHTALASLLRGSDDRPLVANWILRAPIGKHGGGYRTIFRLANDLALRGHHVRVYVEPIPSDHVLGDQEIATFVEREFGPLEVEIAVGHEAIAPADVSIATDWRTAFTVAALRESLFKAYFVQDYEPEFYEEDDPVRAEADSTYDLPLRHIAYGRQLAEHLRERTGIAADSLDIALDPVFAVTIPPEERPGPSRVLFLVPPDQRRRGFELGLEALGILHERQPDVEVQLFGPHDEDLPPLPFPATTLGVLSTEELASALNETHISLSFSFANISHAPYEAMACGCAVVEVDLPHVREALPEGAAALAEPTPAAVAATLEELVCDSSRRIAIARRGIEATAGMSWAKTGAQFDRVLNELAFLRLGSSVGA
jgi:glycosyltransferase involved in cell wall biosynthesis